MKTFTGTLINDTSKDTFKVTGEWEAYVAPGDIDAWRGNVKADDGRSISLGGYTLALPNGKRVTIRVMSAPFSSSAGGYTPFEGSGPLP